MVTNMCTARLEGRVALVTGGGSGMGRASALRLAQEGAAVAVTDVRLDAATAVAKEIKDLAGNAMAVDCDVVDEASVGDAVASAVETFGRLDALVVCAGVMIPCSTHDITLEDWHRVIGVNLTGVFLPVKHAIPHLLKAGDGTIVTIGSTASLVGSGRSATYAASKGGVLQLTRYVAVEYADQGLRANCLCPGKVSTSIRKNSAALVGGARPSAVTVGPHDLRPAPIARSADPSEIASVVAFLCSSDSSFMTGTAVTVDGGYTAI
jgi:3-oxoacyl-[acyl-carrier protein] reductase